MSEYTCHFGSRDLWEVVQWQVDGHVISFRKCEDGRAVLVVDHTSVEFNDEEYYAIAHAMLRDAPRSEGGE
jgi:hypothetical protein